MPANECIPYFEPGTRIPASVLSGKSVTGRRFVKVPETSQSPLEGLNTSTGGGNIQIEPAGAGDTPLGVASHDAAAGDKVTVLRGPMVVPVLAGGTIEAGDKISVGAEGKAVKATPQEVEAEKVTQEGTVVVGIAVADAESGKPAAVALNV